MNNEEKIFKKLKILFSNKDVYLESIQLIQEILPIHPIYIKNDVFLLFNNSIILKHTKILIKNDNYINYWEQVYPIYTHKGLSWRTVSHDYLFRGKKIGKIYDINIYTEL
jgi:hypothetical protein